jgi:hypothetical protein
MDGAFERKLRAAVSAGWRVLVVEVGLLTIVWVVYLLIMSAHPPAILALCGPDVTWPTVATISLQSIAVFKVALWLQAALLAWGALWASILRRSNAPLAVGGSARSPARKVEEQAAPNRRGIAVREAIDAQHDQPSVDP